MAHSDPRIPRLRAWHPLGHLTSMREDMLEFQRDLVRRGDVVRARLGPTDTVWVNSPSAIDEVLRARAEDYEKGPALTEVLRPIVGDGILASQGSRHRRRRAIVTPPLTAGRIAQYADAMVRETDRSIDQALGHGRTDVAHAMMRLTLEILARTLICTDVDGDIRTIDRAVVEGSESFATLLRSPVPLPRAISPAGRRLDRAAKDLDEVVYRIIAERRAGQSKADDILSMLLAARDADTGEALTDVELRDEVMTLLLAGHETTANALTWTLQLLATHPEVARRMEREVDDALEGRVPGFGDLSRLPLTLNVFKEAMRLYPPAFLVGRRSLTESRIGSFHIARGQVVFVNIYGVHHREDVFPCAEGFDPDRFQDGADKRWPKGAYVPFALGPRICVGNHFALMEGQLVLARMAQRLKLAGSIDALAGTEPLVTLRPEGRVYMRAERRRATGQAQSVPPPAAG